jgi:hypothetical protein
MTRIRKSVIAAVAASAGVVALMSMTNAIAVASEGLGVIGSFGAASSAPANPYPLALAATREENGLGSGVAVNSLGEVYVADTGHGRIERFGSTGVFEQWFNGGEINGVPAAQKAPEVLAGAESIAVDDDPSSPSFGDVYVAETREGEIEKFSGTGQFIFQLKTPPANVVAIAVDSSGDLWVRSHNNPRVERFSDAVENAALSSVVESPSSVDDQVAIDSDGNLYLAASVSENNEVTKLGETGATLGEVCGECAYGNLAIAPGTNDLFVAGQTSIAQYGPFGEPFDAPVQVSNPVSPVVGAGLAVSPTNHEVYVADAETNDVVVLADGLTPKETPTTLAATEVKGNSATLHGRLELAAGETKLEYYFEYNHGASCTGGATTPVEVTESDGEVTAEVTGTEPREEYTYCLVAANPFGVTSGTEVPFSTPGAAPVVISESAAYEEGDEGKFSAEVNANNSEEETTCEFEYSTEGSTSANTLEGGVETVGCGEAIPPGTFGEQSIASPRTQPYWGKLATTLYYRVVITNGTGANGTGTTVGPVQAYVKSPTVGGESASALTLTAATVNAEVYPDFQKTKYGVEYASSREKVEKGEGTRIAGKAELKENDEPGPPEAIGVTIAGLEPNVPYYYRVVAENGSTETVHQPTYGEVKEFTTRSLPFVSSGRATNITPTSATLSGTVTAISLGASYYFQYISEPTYQEALAKGLVTPYEDGEATSAVSITASNQAQSVGPVLVSGLLPNTTYRFRLVASNAFGARYGEEGEAEHTFTTAAAAPVSPPPSGGAGGGAPSGGGAIAPPSSEPLFSFPGVSFQLERGGRVPPPVLTRKQKLKKALAVCRKKHGAKRAACAKRARHRYGPKRHNK